MGSAYRNNINCTNVPNITLTKNLPGLPLIGDYFFIFADVCAIKSRQTYRKTFTDVSFDASKLRKFWDSVKEKATVDAYVGVHWFAMPWFCVFIHETRCCVIHSHAWASSCSILLSKAIRRPWSVGASNKIPTFFFL